MLFDELKTVLNIIRKRIKVSMSSKNRIYSLLVDNGGAGYQRGFKL